MTFFNSVNQELQKAAGRMHVITDTQLSAQLRKDMTDPVWQLYTPSSPIRAGWYMLTVNGIKAALGRDFQMRTPDGEIHHLLIGSKAQSKRILYLSCDCTRLEFSVANFYQQLLGMDFSLSRLSTGFAQSRMRKKLQYSTGSISAVKTVVALYLDYKQLVQRHVHKIDYTEWLTHRQRCAENESPTGDIQMQSSTVAIVSLDPSTKTDSITAMIHALPESVRSRVTVLLNTTDDCAALKTELPPDRIIELHGKADADEQGSALDELTADYLLILHSDVKPDPKALTMLLQSVEHRPDAELLYSDHDVLGPDGQRTQPVFKPSWNPELLMSGNYIGRCILISAALVARAGGLKPEMGDSMIYQLLLNCIDSVDEDKVLRVAELLFSRFAGACESSAYMSCGRRDIPVLGDYIDRHNLDGTIEPGLMDDSFRVKWCVPADSPPSVDIIIPTRDCVELLRCCISSILTLTHYSDYQITVVDNDSSDPNTFAYYEELKRDSRFRLVTYAGEFNYSAINNYAVSQSTGDVIVLLNNDTEVCHASWLSEMVGQAIRPRSGCIGAKLYYSNNLIQHAGVIVGVKGVAGHAHRFLDRHDDGYCGRLKLAHNVSAVTAACLAVRRQVFESVNGLDSVNLKVAYNDVDFCLRVREAGYQNIWTPFAELYHHESVSRGSDDSRAKAKRFQREYNYMLKRWHTNEITDPAYNPNLALDMEDFSLAA